MTNAGIKTVIGTTGIAASEVAQKIDFDQIQEGTGLIVQIIIAITTLIGLFKKKRQNDRN